MTPNGRLTRLDFEGLTTRVPILSGINAKGAVVGWVEPELLDFRYHGWIASPNKKVELLWHTFHEFETCCINDAGEILVREWGGGHGALMTLGGFDFFRDVSKDLYPIAINNERQIVGRGWVWSDEIGEWTWVGFYWSPAAGYVEIGGTALRFAALNNRGVAVGTRNGRAFAWSFRSGFIDLGPGSATDINDRNEIVGTREGRTILWGARR